MTEQIPINEVNQVVIPWPDGNPKSGEEGEKLWILYNSPEGLVPLSGLGDMGVSYVWVTYGDSDIYWLIQDPFSNKVSALFFFFFLNEVPLSMGIFCLNIVYMCNSIYKLINTERLLCVITDQLISKGLFPSVVLVSWARSERHVWWSLCSITHHSLTLFGLTVWSTCCTAPLLSWCLPHAWCRVLRMPLRTVLPVPKRLAPLTMEWT